MWGLGRSSISVAHRVDDLKIKFFDTWEMCFVAHRIDDLEKLSKAFNDHLRVAHRVDDLEIQMQTD